MEKEQIRKIFEEIENAMLESLTPEPVRFNESRFRIRFEKIKNRWLNDD